MPSVCTRRNGAANRPRRNRVATESHTAWRLLGYSAAGGTEGIFSFPACFFFLYNFSRIRVHCRGVLGENFGQRTLFRRSRGGAYKEYPAIFTPVPERARFCPHLRSTRLHHQ